MRIAVAGGTGLAGRLVVDAALAAGHQVSVIARSRGADLITGDGLDDALRGASAVIDASNVTTMSRARATAFFGTATQNLLAAGQRAGVAHHVVLSIVGVDRVPVGYYQAKLHQEELVLAGGHPASVLRVTQFFEFPEQFLSRVRGPVAFMPAMLSQPIAAREAAAALVQLATGAPAGMAPELAGPDVLSMPELARQVLRARGRRRFVVPVPLPGAAGRALRTGGLLPASAGPRGEQTFAQWLSTAPGRSASSPASTSASSSATRSASSSAGQHRAER